MPFAYYARLSREDQATYRASDAVTSIRLPDPGSIRPDVEALQRALAADDAAGVEAASRRIASAVCASLGTAPPEVCVLAVRPSADWGELHGLYTPDDEGAPRIRLWMRTARHARVVAFRTYLRTLLHELGHHLDLAVLGLAWSFHTEGFFKRESSLFHQLVPDGRQAVGSGSPSSRIRSGETSSARARSASS